MRTRPFIHAIKAERYFDKDATPREYYGEVVEDHLDYPYIERATGRLYLDEKPVACCKPPKTITGIQNRPYVIPHRHIRSLGQGYRTKLLAEDYDRALKDWKILEKYENGDWHYSGVIAKAEIGIQTEAPSGEQFSVQALTAKTKGLWGIESNSEPAYFKQCAEEEFDKLACVLEAMGFSADEIKTARDEALWLIAEDLDL